jgi:hypothetical protein
VILYILLCGLPPFWGENEKAIFDAILVGKVDFSEDPWPSISAPAKDLVTKLLAKDVRARLTVEQALKHPWVADAESAPDAPLDSAVLSRMRTFANQSKFKQLARGARARLHAARLHACACALRACSRRMRALCCSHRCCCAGHADAGEAPEEGGARRAAQALRGDGRRQERCAIARSHARARARPPHALRL